ncbi:MAG: DUF4328 domain-containing protein [Acidimicrobiia bacterium]|nr:DUF4328 domain-containing protein [Acidimicrobiia bacterium]
MTSCGDCGNDLRDIDRYCPACGKPNVDGKLFPRFEAGVYDEQVLADVPAPGEGQFPCPRCRWPSEAGEVWCHHCGMGLEQAALNAGRSDNAGVWRRSGPVSIDPYRPLGKMTAVVRTVSLFTGLAAVMAMAAAWARVVTVDADGPTVDEPATYWATVVTIVAVTSGLIALAAAVVWTNRAVRNLPALAITSQRYRPLIAVAGWLIPVVNFWLPRSVMDELWWRSNPSGYPVSARPERTRPPAALALWWPCIVCGVLLLGLSVVAQPTGSAPALDGWRIALALAAVGWAVLAIGFFGMALVVAEVSDRQEVRGERLGPPPVELRREVDPDDPDETIDLSDTEVPLRSSEDVTWGRY